MAKFDKSLVGQEFDLGVAEADERALIAYARALGETNPLYVDPEAAAAGEYGAIIAMPTAYAVLKRGHDWGEGTSRPKATGVLAGETCEILGVVRAGDQLAARGRYVDVYEKTGRSGKMTFVVQETSYTNQHGELVLRVRNTMMRR